MPSSVVTLGFWILSFQKTYRKKVGPDVVFSEFSLLHKTYENNYVGHYLDGICDTEKVVHRKKMKKKITTVKAVYLFSSESKPIDS